MILFNKPILIFINIQTDLPHTVAVKSPDLVGRHPKLCLQNFFDSPKKLPIFVDFIPILTKNQPIVRKIKVVKTNFS